MMTVSRLLDQVLNRHTNITQEADMETLKVALEALKADLLVLQAADLSADIAVLESIIVQLQTVRDNLAALNLADTQGMILHVDNALTQLATFDTSTQATLGI